MKLISVGDKARRRFGQSDIIIQEIYACSRVIKSPLERFNLKNVDSMMVTEEGKTHRFRIFPDDLITHVYHEIGL